ncbi:MAG: BMP family ABC transporter substrate-binding protein [Clostridiales bacterium]|uniref:BMP family ABC transporter substrate-binding protein n=1 Tax=Intestinimonas massiliensis (ex Afouda et al. 2020) TaxID=1673721 RepID=A0ABS9M979_9FIRM|nr:BMP family ABC transporter substrate-binding protein [Intestinimonas massiliensis (ex Afouda et al. 2020)]MCG4527188.1 BMP family ABC transporter substrate-binding protein [Intestinimonas massiliensis (ex Afouda et al. 2020)]MCQ4806274.1 BMP family ABC transporter substrate-binding protein [Intestinimonas massiliensis (ex Afouda et al. 2020)]MDU1325477.1 BMP family ABC transporter substrate-binding protein [Clostridiales bacterium]
MKNSKKLVALLLSLSMVFALAACGGGSTASPSPSASQPAPTESAPAETTPAAADFSVAMITDYGDITDQSFNQTTYEACKAYCDANGVPFNYYKPAGDSTAERVAMVEAAADEGYNVIVMPGYAFGETITQVAEEYADVTFIALDVGEGDLGDYTLPSNVYCAVYQEELCGYMAGYAAVKLGYTHLGFLGGMAVPAVVRYGYGFVQGADAAAVEAGADVTVEYVYGNQFFGDADITAYMDNWYQTLGVQAVFACGGGIYASAAEAAAKVDGAKVIGVDVDQAGIIDGAYGAGMTVTSAMKGLAPTVQHMLEEVAAGNFANYGGKIETLGLVSGDDPTANYVQIPMETTQWGDGFTQDDYKTLVKAMFDGTVTVSNDITAMPAVTITVNEYGNIK